MRLALVGAVAGAFALLSVPLAGGAAADPTCSWSPPFTSVIEGNGGTVVASLELRCANPTTETFTVRFTLGQGTAVSPADYAAASGDIAVPPGDSATRIDVDVFGDTRPEATEQLGILLTEASGRVTSPTALVNIVDDDGFGISTTPPSVPEGNAGPTVVDVEVRFSDPLEYPFDVTLYTVAGTATAGSDYESMNQSKRFQPGELSKTFPVTVLGDTEDEPDETVFIGLASGGVQTLSSGYLTILDDDEPGPLATCSIGDGDGSLEGTSRASGTEFRVFCENPTSTTLSIDFETSDGTATSPGDFVAASGSLEVDPGSTSVTFVVGFVPDADPERDETFVVTLSDPSGQVALPKPSTTRTIVDDDGFPRIFVRPVSVSEGDSGFTDVEVELRFADPPGGEVTVDYATASDPNVDGSDARPGEDFEETAGSVTFGPGETTQFLTVRIFGDAELEQDESVRIALSSTADVNLGNGEVRTRVGIKILDDDAPGAGPCLLVSEDELSVTGELSTPDRRSLSTSPRFVVENCGAGAVELDVRGTDATGAAGTWSLTNEPSGGPIDSTCDLGVDLFRAAVTVWAADGSGEGTPLTEADRRLLGPDGTTPFSLEPAATQELSPEIELPCEGSVGLGEPMTTQITLTAVVP